MSRLREDFKLLQEKEIELGSSGLMGEEGASQPAMSPLMASSRHTEHALLLSACRVANDPASASRVQRLLSGNLDWNYLISLAKKHAVVPLLLRGLKSVNAGAIPADIRPTLESFCERQRKRNLLLTAELVRIVGALTNRGIATLPFKGPILGQMVYRDLGLRSFADLDFLIQEKDISPCMEVLGKLGYYGHAPLTKAQEASMWKKNGQRLLFRKDGLVAVEPHVRLAPATLGLRIDYPGLWRRAISVDLFGTKVLSLSPEDLVIMLCVHGAKDQWSQLNWICDLSETLRACPALGWEAIPDHAQSQHCLRMLLLGLALANRLQGSPLPASVAAILSVDPVARRLADEVEWNLFAPNYLVPSIWKVSRFRVKMHDGFTDKLSYVVRTVITPGRPHTGIISLPRSLYFGYYPTKLVFDYFLLPIWRVKKALF